MSCEKKSIFTVYYNKLQYSKLQNKIRTYIISKGTIVKNGS